MPLNPDAPPPAVSERIIARVSATVRRYGEVVLFGAGLVVGALLVMLGRLLP